MTQPEGTTRRSFLFRAGVVLNAFAASLVAIPVIGYAVAVAFRSGAQQSWVSLGKLDEFPAGQTRLTSYRNPFTVKWDGVTANIPCWVRHIAGNDFQVFAINCAHLGCPVRWFPQSGLFMCPCHGGVYYENGDVASGPPPRGLFEYEYRVEKDTLYVKAGRLPTMAEPTA